MFFDIMFFDIICPFAQAVSSATAASKPFQAYDQELWKWDVLICHAGSDKVFAQSLRDQLLPLRVLVCEDSPSTCTDALQAVEAAVRSTFVAVVLLCEELFQEAAPLRELRWFLEGCRQGMNKIIPVFLGITWERCELLAQKAGLAWALDIAAVQHVTESPRVPDKLMRCKETLQLVVKSVRDLTGAHSSSTRSYNMICIVLTSKCIRKQITSH